jgi:hypothetical protein
MVINILKYKNKTYYCKQANAPKAGCSKEIITFDLQQSHGKYKMSVTSVKEHKHTLS